MLQAMLLDKFSKFSGHIKIWNTNAATGDSTLLVDKNNLIVYSGADILAKALAGVTDYKISHMYVGYKDPGAGSPAPAIAKANSIVVYDSLISDSDYGFLRIPLSLIPSFFNETNYNNNNVVFTSTVLSGVEEHGLTFADGVEIFEAGLACELTKGVRQDDVLFSRASFTEIVYNNNYNLTISWAVKFTA